MKNKMIIERKIMFLLVLLIGNFLLFRDGLNPPKYKDRGIVEKKMMIPQGKSSTDLMLFIKFEKTGEKAIEVNSTTYMKYERGDKVCFMLRDKSKESEYALISMYKLLSLFILVIWVFHWIVTKWG